MKMSSKKTMLTAAVLVTLSSGTAFAATPGTADAQELLHSDRLETDRSENSAAEEIAVSNRGTAPASSEKSSEAGSSAQSAASEKVQEPTRLRWESVDTRIAERNTQPSFTLAVQKPKPVIITAEDVKHEEKQSAKEGRPAQELVGDVNIHRDTPPQNPVQPVTPPIQHVVQEQTAQLPAEKPVQAVQDKTVQSSSSNVEENAEQRPSRPRYPQMPEKSFSLEHPTDIGSVPKQPERFHVLEENSVQRLNSPVTKDSIPVVEHSVRPEGVPAFSSNEIEPNGDADLAGISDEVRRYILAGQLAMEVQLRRDPSVAGMRMIAKVLRENTTLTRLQKIDFLIGFGRALHRSHLPRQQEALLIKALAEAY